MEIKERKRNINYIIRIDMVIGNINIASMHAHEDSTQGVPNDFTNVINAW